MKNILTLVLVTLAVFFTACDDYVDLTPKGLVIPESVKDLQKIFNNDRNIFRSGHINDFLMHDDGYVPPSLVSSFQTGVVSEHSVRSYQLMDYFFLNTESDPDWEGNYKLIGSANYILGRLDRASGSQSDKDDLKGQALLHRAYSYLILINLYAQHYAAGDPTTLESGVPLITTFGNPNVSVTRSSIEEVYDLITTDLTEALTLLKADFSNLKFEATRVVAFGLLARVYLHKEEYELAITNASSALAIQNTLTNYPEKLPELDYTLGYDRNFPANPSLENITEIIMNKGIRLPFYFSFFPSPGIAPFTYVTPEVVALYNQDYDTRFKYLIDFNASVGAYRWTGGDISIITGCNLTVPEILLIRAESNARLGNVDEAMVDLNDLRTHRFDTDDPAIVNLTATTSEEALQHALEERRRELVYRGTRFFDIKRLNAIDNAGIGIERLDFQGNSITLPAGDPRWAIAIPPKEVSLRPEIKQNPR